MILIHKAGLLFLAGLALYQLPGCAMRGEQSTDLVVSRLHWYRDMSNFRFQKSEWNVISGPNKYQRLANLCAGGDNQFMSTACTVRIKEGGQCVTFSVYTREQARYDVLDGSGEPLETHELSHCGVNMPLPGGYRHRESVVIR